MADDRLTAAAADLFALPLAEFTAERNARAKAARADGDRDLAARISALAKPSAAAWVVNALAREAPEDLQRVLDLGADLREAQDDADRDRLRALTGQRRTLLAEVARSAAALAEAAGQHVSDAVLEEVQQSLQAALSSPEAAAAVRTGRLVRALDTDGLDPVDLDDAVAGAAGRPAPRSARRAAPEEDDGEQARREAEERAQRLREARDRARSSAAEARDADADVEDRGHDVDDLRKRIDELQDRLGLAQEALEHAEAAAEAAHERADDAGAEVERLTAEG